MNDFIPITDDGLVGKDQFGQIWAIQADDTSMRTMIRDPRGQVCNICGKGWLNTRDSMVDHAYIDGHWMHKTCYIGHLKLNERSMWETAFSKALRPHGGWKGMKDRYEIDSQYPSGWGTPWYQCEYHRSDLNVRGQFTFGRRKRVWSISYKGDSPFASPDELKPLGDEDVTFDVTDFEVLIHAWTVPKVDEYIARIINAIHPETADVEVSAG